MIKESYVLVDKGSMTKSNKRAIHKIGKTLVEDFGSKIKIKAKKLNDGFIQIYTNEYTTIDSKKIHSLFNNDPFIHKKEIHLCYETTNKSYLVITGKTESIKELKQDVDDDEYTFKYINPVFHKTNFFKKQVKNPEILKGVDYFCKYFMNNIFLKYLEKDILNEKGFHFTYGLEGNTIQNRYKVEPPDGIIDLDKLYNIIHCFTHTRDYFLDFNHLFYLKDKTGEFRFECERLKSRSKRKRTDSNYETTTNKKIKI
jgi:hypothetical protein